MTKNAAVETADSKRLSKVRPNVQTAVGPVVDPCCCPSAISLCFACFASFLSEASLTALLPLFRTESRLVCSSSSPSIAAAKGNDSRLFVFLAGGCLLCCFRAATNTHSSDCEVMLVKRDGHVVRSTYLDPSCDAALSQTRFHTTVAVVYPAQIYFHSIGPAPPIVYRHS
jgi:hypothetical protein